jgi:hypothetical protein
MLTAVWFLAACGGGDGTTDPGNGNPNPNPNPTGTSRMTATIDGQSWSANTATGSVTAIQFAPKSGGYLILAIGSGVAASVSFTINGIIRTGTYPLGVDGVSVFGGFAGLTVGAGGVWTTPISGAAGSITITTLTPTQIAGTFVFTATGSGGGATGAKAVTNGTFDVPMSSNAPIAVLTDSMGGTLKASLNGQAWNAGIVSGQTTATHLSVSGINNLQTLIFTIPKPTGTGTFQLSNNSGSILVAWDPNAVAPAGARCCYGIAGDVGTMTITSLTTTRIKGTLSATLRAQPGTAAGTGTLVITNGVFDMGLFHTP